MPLSSSSLPSLGSSGSEDIAAPSFTRLAMLSASEVPNAAGGKDRKRRPNLPSNKGERVVDINPRGGPACFPLINGLLRGVGTGCGYLFKLSKTPSRNSGQITVCADDARASQSPK